MKKYAKLVSTYLEDINIASSHSIMEKGLLVEFANWLDMVNDGQPSCSICRHYAQCGILDHEECGNFESKIE